MTDSWKSFVFSALPTPHNHFSEYLISNANLSSISLANMYCCQWRFDISVLLFFAKEHFQNPYSYFPTFLLPLIWIIESFWEFLIWSQTMIINENGENFGKCPLKNDQLAKTGNLHSISSLSPHTNIHNDQTNTFQIDNFDGAIDVSNPST